MSGRTSAPVEQAIKVYKAGNSVYKLASQFGVSASTLYRALKACGKIKRKKA